MPSLPSFPLPVFPSLCLLSYPYYYSQPGLKCSKEPRYKDWQLLYWKAGVLILPVRHIHHLPITTRNGQGSPEDFHLIYKLHSCAYKSASPWGSCTHCHCTLCKGNGTQMDHCQHIDASMHSCGSAHSWKLLCTVPTDGLTILQRLLDHNPLGYSYSHLLFAYMNIW